MYYIIGKSAQHFLCVNMCVTEGTINEIDLNIKKM